MLRLIVVARRCKVYDVMVAAPRSVLVAALLDQDSEYKPDDSDLDMLERSDLHYDLGLPVCEEDLLQQVNNRLRNVASRMTISAAAEVSQVLHELQDVETAQHVFRQTLTFIDDRT
jgi:hypothetical protein